MDVLLIDDKDAEAVLLEREWEPHGIRVLHSDDLADVAVMMSGGHPPGWPAPPYPVTMAIVDVDLGHKGPGPAGGVMATQKLATWARRIQRTIPVMLRTADVDDDRSLAAVLAAELAGGPLPLWGKSVSDARSLIAYVLTSQCDTPRASDYKAKVVHPVTFVREERGERQLGDFLYNGSRADVWELLQQGFDHQTAILSAGYGNHNKFWEPLHGLIASICHLRDNGTQLHTLEGRPIRVAEIERQINAEVVEDIEIAIYAVHSMPDATDETKTRIIATLEATKLQCLDWLEHGGKRPSQNRNVDQGEFLGAFGRVLGHPDVVDLFKH